jgi:uncharacterized protein (DUF924 family)
MATAEEILDFWFGELDEGGNLTEDRSSLWWRGGPQIDAEIRARFESDVLEAAAGRRDDWAGRAEGTLALLICLDQLSRNIFRDTPRAFAQDPRARYLALQGIESGVDRRLAPIQRVFFYMPLEHAEDPALQRRSVALFEELYRTAPVERREAFRVFLDYAERHKAVVDRFGRFPHRNVILGRESTAEERAFLEGPAAPF